jgi:hypothetical protein
MIKLEATMTTLELYTTAVKPLPENERLQLAALILNDIAGQPVDVSDEWTEQDMQDFTNAGLRHIDKMMEQENG